MLNMWFCGICLLRREGPSQAQSVTLVWINAEISLNGKIKSILYWSTRPPGSASFSYSEGFLKNRDKINFVKMLLSDSVFLAFMSKVSQFEFDSEGNGTFHSNVSNMYFRSIHHNFHNPSTTSQYRIYPSKVCWVNWIWSSTYLFWICPQENM